MGEMMVNDGEFVEIMVNHGEFTVEIMGKYGRNDGESWVY